MTCVMDLYWIYNNIFMINDYVFVKVMICDLDFNVYRLLNDWNIGLKWFGVKFTLLLQM